MNKYKNIGKPEEIPKPPQNFSQHDNTDRGASPANKKGKAAKRDNSASPSPKKKK